ncbi:MAG: hypothetical protein KAR00_02970 [Candidatus Pacebacteria bacterium]|nr:hypothetical protein [Candidatus Paceibacterota bacterium]
MSIGPFLNSVSEVIIDPFIRLLFAVAMIVFVWGVVQYVISGKGEGGLTDNDRLQGKRAIMWGLIGMFIMGSVYGIVQVLIGTFGIYSPSFP